MKAVALALLALLAADPDRVRTAKALYFDRKYAEARKAWQDVLAASSGREAEAAAYWVARSSESLGEHERAFREFGEFVARKPQNRELYQEARLHQLGLAARLAKEGKRQHLALLSEALRDGNATVREYAALQLSNLGPSAAREAVPVLKDIVARGEDDDLVQRAKLALLRVEPSALAEVTPRPEQPPRTGARWLEVRIHEPGGKRPKVYVRLPMALAEVLFKSLPDEAREELRREGYDAENFWDQLQRLQPGRVLDIEGEDGARIHISLE